MQTERDIAAIAKLVPCEMCELTQGVSDANAAISTLQMIEAAVRSIRHNLRSMEELAERDVNRYCTCAEKAVMQRKLLEYAQLVNQTVDALDMVSADGSEHNKLLSGEGQKIDISVGRGRSLHIFPIDLNFPTEGIDLTKNGKAALAAIKDIYARANEYVDYLEGQSAFLLEIISTMEQRVAASQKIGAMDFSMISDSAAMIGEMFAEQPELMYDCQANVSHGSALRVLYH